VFRGNLASAHFGAGVLVHRCEASFDECVFEGNQARKGGGGLDNNGGVCNLARCVFKGNSAGDEGGGIDSYGELSVVRCTLHGNASGRFGGGLYATSRPALWVHQSRFTANGSDHGGAIAVYDGPAHLTNITLVGNSASDGRAITLLEGAEVEVNNSILWNGGGEISLSDPEQQASVRYSDVFGGFEGPGNLDAVPYFVRPPDDGGDGWGDDPDTPGVDEGANDDLGDLHLRYWSECIDSGDNEAIGGSKTDLDGNPRVVNDVVDMGAYEFQGARILQVRIDVRPGNDVDPIKIGSRGVLPIAILSSASFDALTIDPSTILVAGAGVAVRGNGRHYLTVERDVDGDGLVDLVVHVETAGVEVEANSAKIVLTGQTYDDVAIFGRDFVTTVGR